MTEREVTAYHAERHFHYEVERPRPATHCRTSCYKHNLQRLPIGADVWIKSLQKAKTEDTLPECCHLCFYLEDCRSIWVVGERANCSIFIYSLPPLQNTVRTHLYPRTLYCIAGTLYSDALGLHHLESIVSSVRMSSGVFTHPTCI